MKDSDFINQFAMVLGVLIAIGVLIFIIANNFSAMPGPTATMTEIIKDRIKPVGVAHVGEVAMEISEEMPQANTAKSEDLSGEQIYQQVCAVCHAAGILNSPIYGDAAAWATRLGDIEVLYASSINGKGQMPAKGGRVDLSDDAIKAAVDYMLDAVR